MTDEQIFPIRFEVHEKEMKKVDHKRISLSPMAREPACLGIFHLQKKFMQVHFQDFEWQHSKMINLSALQEAIPSWWQRTEPLLPPLKKIGICMRYTSHIKIPAVCYA